MKRYIGWRNRALNIVSQVLTPFAGQRKLTGCEELVLTQLARRAKVDRIRLASVQTSTGRKTATPPGPVLARGNCGWLPKGASRWRQGLVGDWSCWVIYFRSRLVRWPHPQGWLFSIRKFLQNGPMFHEDWRLSLVKSDQLRSISARPRVIFSRCWWARCYVLPSELLFFVRICIPIYQVYQQMS